MPIVPGRIERLEILVQALRRLFGLPWMLPLTALLLRARTVRPSAGFVLSEVLGDHGARRYRLASNGLRVIIRHGSPDVVTLGEVFHDWDYVPPAEAERLLCDRPAILDLGANIGLFGVFAAARWPGSTTTGFEPDPANVAVHRRAITANALGPRWTLVPAAAGADDGMMPFLAGLGSLSQLVPAGGSGAIDVPVQDVLGKIAEADLLKMDIEGGEWAILHDPRFRARPPRVIVLEYHPHLCPSDQPRAAAEAALGAAGMTVRSIKHLPTGHGMLWGWRS